MRKTIFTLLIVLWSFVTYGQNKVSVDATQTNTQINKHIYGHFAEHLGRCVYDGIYVGEDSSIPNTDGVRNDVIEALKKLNIPNLRWPGGCFADIYHWKDGIGPKNERKHIENLSWGNVREDNSFGTHEFLNLCELLGAEPYLAANMNSGSVQEAVDWMQYVNHPKGSSYLTDLREENGREDPWSVKFWGLGNESWDCGGHMTPDYYSNLYRRYATAITNYDNTENLFRIAVGPGEPNYVWTDVVMKNIPLRRIEGLSIHHYSVFDWVNKGPSQTFTDEQYFKTMKRAWFMDEFIRKNSEVMDKYDPAKKVALVVDEWGGWYTPEPGKGMLYQQNTIRDAMIAGMTLNIFNNHADRVRMANLAQTVNVLQAVILTDKEKLVLTPTYHVMEMYKVHQDAMLAPVQVISEEFVVGEDRIPAVSVSASVDKSGKMHISLTNVDNTSSKKVEIDINGFAASKVTGRVLTSAKVQDYNAFDNPDKITPQAFDKASIKKGLLTVDMPTNSVVVLELTK